MVLMKMGVHVQVTIIIMTCNHASVRYRGARENNRSDKREECDTYLLVQFEFVDVDCVETTLGSASAGKEQGVNVLHVAGAIDDDRGNQRHA